MNGAPRLADVQKLFWELIAAPEGVEPELKARDANGDDARSRLRAWVASDGRLSAEGRLEVYASMYFYRIKDALTQDFEKTAAILGEARWHDLLTDYLLAHPSERPSIRWVGQALPTFIGAHRFGTSPPWLADLAALEWAWSDTFQEIDSPVLAAADLGAVPPERWGDLRFAPVAALRLLTPAWDVAPLWKRMHAGEEAGAEPLVEAATGPTVVFRERFAPEVIPLRPDEGEALRALLGGESFGEICAGLAGDGEDADIEAAAARAAGFLSRWIVSGYLSRFDLAG